MTFKIGRAAHLVHMSNDFTELNEWYRKVFNPRYFVDHMTDVFPTWELEKRDATLIAIADTVIEPMAPAMHLEGWQELPVGRFYNRFGRHWHSIGWYVEDSLDLYRRLKTDGVRVFFNGGGSDGDREPTARDPLFPHPKDTAGALEFMQDPMADDPRYLPGWADDWWATSHPLTLRRLSHVTLAVADLEKAKSVYVTTFGGQVLSETTSDLTGTQNTFVLVGQDTVVNLAVPVRDRTLVTADLERNGACVHSVTWTVDDLDAAQRHLTDAGVAILDRDETTLLADPATTFGAVMLFSSTPVVGDQRAG